MSKTLVIILSEICNCETTFNSFKKNVIDELNADLCLCSCIISDYNYDNNLFYQLAKYKYFYDSTDDFRDPFDYAYNIEINNRPKYERLNNKNALWGKIDRDQSNNSDITFYGYYEDINNFDEFQDDEIIIHKNNLEDEFWRNKVYGIKKSDNTTLVNQKNIVTYKKHKHWSEFLKIKGYFLGGIKNNKNQHYGCGSKLIFLRWFLLQKLIEDDLINKYDRFIITRSDFIYQLPHPKVEYMNENYIWFPNCEHYGGYTDRHVVLSRKHVKKYLNLLHDFIMKSNEYFLKMNERDFWNLQKIILLHLQQNNMQHIVKEFPYIMYSIREYVTGSINNIDINYPTEYEKSYFYKDQFEKSGLVTDDFYKNHIIDYKNNIEITAITVCVNFYDILSHILEHNSFFFKLWYIVTSPEDTKTINFIKNKQLSNVKILIYNDFYNNAKFNKGGAVRFAQQHIENNTTIINNKTQTILILDSDIYLPDNFLEKIPKKFEDNTLYGVRERRDFWSLDDFLNNENGHYSQSSQTFIGFFQLYKQFTYKYNNSYNCSECDNNFRDLFPNKVTLDLYVKHLGREKINWDGRNNAVIGFFIEPE